MKTHRGAAKRFRVSGTGKLMRKKANNGHLFTHKSAKRLRHLERETEVAPADDANVRGLLGVPKPKK